MKTWRSFLLSAAAGICGSLWNLQDKMWFIIALCIYALWLIDALIEETKVKR